MKSVIKKSYQLFGIHSYRINILIAALLLSLIPSVEAVLGARTGTIVGHAPTIDDSVFQIYLPDGTTPVTSGQSINPNLKPIDFKVNIPWVDVNDEDNDTGLNYSYSPTDLTLIWTDLRTHLPLTPAQLNSTFSDNAFSHLSVTAQGLVDASSLTGTPTTQRYLLNSPDVVLLPAIIRHPVISTNYTKFALNSGFPTTGFAGARFFYFMNGKDISENGYYNFKIDPPQSWIQITDRGVVTFRSVPTSSAAATVTVKITDKAGVFPVLTDTFTLKNWFFTTLNTSSWIDAQKYCQTLNSVLPQTRFLTGQTDDVNGILGIIGGLWSEWGKASMFNYPSTITTWTSDIYPNGNYHAVVLNDGSLRSVPPSSALYVYCQLVL
ncbi:hypothetical protein [Yersinia intermedia]|uniref:hypothetical protein n=1 Tax=Yersinia intermedia TaxID=631 RepID=UPI0005E66C8A|nr:hypothetical protein [Yersinia intermedia]CND47638.1 Invasin [Yersinia intermedia]